MIEIFYRWNNMVIQNSDKKEIIFWISSKEVFLDWFDVTFPWEYEKSDILLEVKEYNEKLFYNFLMEWKHIIIVPEDNFDLKENILTFFWEVDILLIIWTKEATKVFENIEAKIVIPYGSEKDMFLNTIWQHRLEELKIYKQKWELPIDTTEFVNLGQ